MSNKTDIQKQEAKSTPGVERTRERTVYIPKADIYETKDKIVLLVDLPGVDDKSLDITLEKSVLTINGSVKADDIGGHSLIYSEYQSGDYQRSFTLSSEVDDGKITATIANGQLTLTLPKSERAKARRIAIASGS
ncbi:MAG: Hsp20/alpha crystallin family protein [bacterium]|nr:Hsp20/alpha crystallin family protein [bacterium]